MLAGATFAWFSDTVTSGQNQILAGNLDVELEYSSDFGNKDAWASVKDADDLFLKDTLWEPGHAEVVYLKLTNKGSLAVDWKLMTYAYSETTGKNEKNESIKLSNYIKFAVVPVTAAYSTRAKAIAAAGEENLVSLGEYTKSATAVTSETTETYALIAYMPTTVGNEANYKTGTTPPSIDFAIRLEATQAQYEKDSFGENYDADADGTPDNPEIGQYVTTVETEASAFETTVTEDATGKKTESTTKEATVDAGDITVTYPEGTVLNTDASKKNAGNSTADATQGLVLTDDDTKASISLSDGQVAAVYELTLPVAETNTTWIKVVENVGAEQTIAAVYHNTTVLGTANNEDYTPDVVETSGDEGYYYYNSSSGKLTLWVHHASQLTVQYSSLFNGGNGTKKSPYEIATVQQLANVYKMGTTNGYYYKLTNNIDVGSGMYTVGGTINVAVPFLLNSTFDGNGKTITISQASKFATVFYEVENSTIKNLTVQTTDAQLMYIANYSGTQVTIENVTMKGKIAVGGNESAFLIYDYGTKADSKLTFKNCVSEVTMTGTSYNAVFVGHIVSGAQNAQLTFENCENKGKLVCRRAAMFVGNANTQAGSAALTVTNCTNSGTIQATATLANETGYVANFYRAIGSSTFTVNEEDCPYAVNAEDAFAVAEGVVTNTGKAIQGPTSTGMGITKNNDDTFTITPATNGKIEDVEVASYKVYVGLYTTLKAGGTNRFYATETIKANDITGDSYTTTMKSLSFVDQTWADTNSSATYETVGDNTIYTLGSTSYYMIGDNDKETLNGTPKAPQMTYVYAYDADGNVLATETLSK
jgi:predicted ribosomally synthesized peptide with SipW-like signal peptide